MKANFRDNSKKDIEINRKTTVVQSSATFDYHDVQSNSAAEFRSISHILSEKCDKQMVSLKVYVDIAECPISTIDTKRCKLERLECYINDDSGQMKLTIWGSHVTQLAQSGVYEILNVFVRECLDEIVVNTVSDTIIRPLPDLNIERKEHIPMYHSVSFPFLNVKITNRVQKCLDCGHSISENSDTTKYFFRCPVCSTRVTSKVNRKNPCYQRIAGNRNVLISVRRVLWRTWHWPNWWRSNYWWNVAGWENNNDR